MQILFIYLEIKDPEYSMCTKIKATIHVSIIFFVWFSWLLFGRLVTMI